MPVTDLQAAAFRAQLGGHVEEYRRLAASLDSKADSLGYSALLTAAFHSAVALRFTRESTLDEVAEFVAGVRGRCGRLAAALDPHVAGRVIVDSVVGGDYILKLCSAESVKMKLLLLGGLISDMHLDDAGLDDLVGKARAFADELLSR